MKYAVLNVMLLCLLMGLAGCGAGKSSGQPGYEKHGGEEVDAIRKRMNDPPTYACVGENDGIASWRTMENRLHNLEAAGVPTEFHKYLGFGHGFGLGTGTVAEGWIDDAVTFWENQKGGSDDE